MGNQKRSWNYRAEDSTYDLSIADIGIILPGVYRGFDITLGADMLLRLTHNETGYVVTDIAGGTISPKRGAVVSRQGVVVTEDGAETLPVAVGHPTLDRIDLIIMEHKYIPVAGGQVATYSVVQGSPSANPNPPSVPNLALQVPIGQLLVKSGTTQLATGGTWTRREKPVISGEADNVALKDRENIFTEANSFKNTVSEGYGGSVLVTQSGTEGGIVDKPALNLGNSSGNVFKITDANQLGEINYIKSDAIGEATKVVLEINSNMVIKNGINPSTGTTTPSGSGGGSNTGGGTSGQVGTA